MGTMQERWFGAPIAVTGWEPSDVDRLQHLVARWHQARRQLCLSLLLGQRPDVDDRALVAILPERPLRLEARRWALWLVSGEHGLLAWYRQTLLALPDDALWQREREFYAALKLQDYGGPPEGASRLWRWQRRRGLDLSPWLGTAAGTLAVSAPPSLQPWLDHGAQPLLGQWLVWDGRWLIHLFWPGQPPETRSLPRVAAALLVPSLVSPATTAYRVQKGDTLWTIAQTRTGSGANWRQVYQANRQQIRRPDRIYPGQVLTLPAARSVTPPAISPTPAESIVVQSGDTLWHIAAVQSGHGSWWPQLWQANRDRLRRPDRLPVGTRLRRPLSWSSGPVPVGLPGPAVESAAAPEPPVVTKPVNPPLRPLPSLGRRPGRPTAGVPRALVPPPPVAPPVEPSPVPLRPTIVATVPPPEMARPLRPGRQDLAVPLRPVTPLNPSRPPSASPSALPAEPAAWPEPEPLQPLPEPSESSDAAATARPTAAIPSEPAEEPPVTWLPAEPQDAPATLRPSQGGADPWETWLRPEIPDPAHPQRQAAFTMPHLAPSALWPQIGWTGVPEYLTETAANQPPLTGWALNRQRLSATWQSDGWLIRGRWTTAQYGLAAGSNRADRQESWVDLDVGQRWQVAGPLRLGLLGRATWWQRRGGMGGDASLRAADLQGFGLGPVAQAEVALGGGHHLLAEAAVQPLMGVSFSGPLQAGGQVGQVEGQLGWQGRWGAFQPAVGYRARWVYDADGRFGTLAHGLTAGLAIGWPESGD